MPSWPRPYSAYSASTLASTSAARSDSLIVATWETDRARSASEAAVCGCQKRNCFCSTNPK